MVDITKSSKKLFNEWNYDKNISFDIHNVKVKDKVWWKCEKWHEYEATVNSRNHWTWCPYCSNQKVLKWYNDLSTTNPELSKQWNYDKNWDLTPYKITWKSNKKVWWKCEKWHEWINSPDLRKNNWCPYCWNQKVLKWYNDLATTNPALLKEWDYEKNIINPSDVQAWSELKVRWKCKKWHSFKSRIDTRAKKNYGCPICSKWLHISFPEKVILYYFLNVDKNIIENYKDESIWISELDIFIPDKKIGIEYDWNRWHSDREKDLLKNNVCENNHIKLYRIREYGCPILDSSSIDFYVNDWNFWELSDIINSLIHDIYGVIPNVDIDRDKTDIRKFMELNAKNSADNLPYEIIKQWDYEKNKWLEPSSFSIWTHKKLRWKCEKWHSYECSIANRSNWRWCPYCSSNKLLSWFNDLQTINPKLAKEWNYEKNWELLPNWVFAKSGKKVRWKCKKWHERQAKICNRSNWKWCPYCTGKLK